MNYKKHITLLLLFTFLSFEAKSAGYAIKEQSSSAMGNAYAGVSASTEDISSMFFNPATIGKQKGNKTLFSLSYIVPNFEIRSADATSATFGDVSGITQNAASSDAFIPSFYTLWDISEEINFGLGITSPWGLKTEYDSRSVFRYESIKSEVKTVNISGVLSYNINENLTFAAGPQVQYLEATLKAAANCAPLIAQPTYTADCIVDNHGDDIGYGYLMGLHYEINKLKLGISYRSEIDHSVKGKTRISRPSTTLLATFPDTTVSTNITVPAMANFGVGYDVTPRLTLLGEVQLTRWSVFDRLILNYGSPINGNSQTITEENWKDSFFYALGFTYKTFQNAKLRVGAAFDETPVPDEFKNPRVPDSNRTWLTIGMNYEPREDVIIDFSYARIFMEDSDIVVNASSATDTNLNANYESSIDIFSLQLLYKF